MRQAGWHRRGINASVPAEMQGQGLFYLPALFPQNLKGAIGMSTKEKRDLKAAVAFTKTAFDAVKVAKDGGEISEEKKAEIMGNMNAIDDAQTGGLAEYTRRADAAEAKIN